MRVITVLISVVAIATLTNGDNELAKAKCHSIYNRDVQVADYVNYGCRLLCSVDNKINYHDMTESDQCTKYFGSNVCKNGDCMSMKPLGEHGNIDIEIIRGDLQDMDIGWSPKADGYVITCLQEDHGKQSWPLKDTKGCDCKTKNISENNNPEWHHICNNWPHDAVFKNNTRITFEVWDYDSPDPDDFVGGATITIEELVTSQKNAKEMSLPLTEGEIKGTIWVRVTWKMV